MQTDTEANSEQSNRMFDRFVSKLESNMLVVRFIARSTLSAVLIAIIAMSPMFIWPMLMAWPAPYCYVAFAIWITYFGSVVMIAAILAYIRESKGIQTRINSYNEQTHRYQDET